MNRNKSMSQKDTCSNNGEITMIALFKEYYAIQTDGESPDEHMLELFLELFSEVSDE